MAQGQTATDAELVRESLTGDSDAFAALVERHRRLIYALALQKVHDPADADDVAQETFIKAYRSLHTLRDPARFGSWLYGIALRGAMDWLRLRGKSVSLANDLVPFAASIQDTEEVRELVEAVMNAVGELSDAHRLVITLRYVHGLGAKEIAGQLGEARGAIRSRLFKAAQILRRRLANLISAE